jgi:osmotically inducible protein OsmC
MKSIASAVWEGGIKDGKGRLSAASGIFSDTPYTFARRFEGLGTGTTPEELIAAAHSGCYAMALSGELGRAGFTPQRLSVKATVTIEPVDGKATVTSSALELEGVVPGIDDAKFQEAAANAKANCPISRLLHTNIPLTAKLVR